MRAFWQIVFLFVLVFLSLALPFSIFFYEADSDPRITKIAPWKKAAIQSSVLFVVIGAIVGVSYALLHTAYVPIKCEDPLHPSCPTKPERVATTVGFLDFIIGLCAFVGWWFFFLFGSVGIVALPWDLIMCFIYRPVPIDLATFTEKKRVLGEKAALIRALGESLKVREIRERNTSWWNAFCKRRALKHDYNRLCQSVHLLEEEFSNLNVAFTERGENPFYSYAKLVGGILCAGLSILWFTHIILYMLLPVLIGHTVTGFLNDFLSLIKRWEVYVIDLITYGTLVAYLLASVIKGCLKVGLRVFFLFAVKPMKKGDTHLNTLLFNVAVILLSSAAVAQFSVEAFLEYVEGTVADFVFRIEVENIPFFAFFYDNRLFVWAMSVISLITLVLLIVWPRDTTAVNFNVEVAKGTAVITDANGR